MADLKKLSLEALRELARKSLGREHARFKTKGELIEALSAAKARVASAAEKASRRLGEPTGTGKRGRRKKAEPAPSEPASSVSRDEGRARPARTRRPEAPAAAAGKGGLGPPRPGEPEPDPEGHMVARVMGEEAAREAPHPLTESALGAARPARPRRTQKSATVPFDEALGELPPSYGEDALVALPRDPRTLFVYWDHAGETLRRAFEGLEGARPELWIFAREPDGSLSRLRVVEFALESRSYYLHDLEPGRAYEVEIHLVDRHGQERFVPPRSNPMSLPGAGPSALVDDRFMRILWGEPLQRLLREPRAGLPFPEDLRSELARLSDWARFPGRAMASSGAGGMGGRPTSPSGPSSPSASPGLDGEGP